MYIYTDTKTNHITENVEAISSFASFFPYLINRPSSAEKLIFCSII